ncbi:MBL fold metallo-hydrolase [Ideonella sp.]|uniref:MBL fold metallo-hydrolase n=1 Tax=Ideonella sp. TaxID=1929293 RepID=UPI003BB52409
MTDETAWQALGLTVIQRDWLSANHVVFAPRRSQPERCPATVIDTGHVRHSALTIQLIEHVLQGVPLGRIVNTHLHSDHCGGNAALQQRFAGLQTWVPQASFQTVTHWDEGALSYQPTGQRCPVFQVTGALNGGEHLSLGEADWQVIDAPGHDPDAVMLFEPETRTLISGDALWEDRLAIIFPELVSMEGFEAAAATLDLIERLAPARVIPGHGPAFADAEAALAASRQRLAGFARQPERHARHAARALLMFHVMETQPVSAEALQRWMVQTPLFGRMADLCRVSTLAPWAQTLLDGLMDEGLLVQQAGLIELPSGT